ARTRTNRMTELTEPSRVHSRQRNLITAEAQVAWMSCVRGRLDDLCATTLRCEGQRRIREDWRFAMTVATSTLLGRPLWYELMTSDMKAAEGFYKTVVGWTTTPFEGAAQPYTMFNRGADVPIGGVMTKPDAVKAPPFWAMYIGVP